MANILDILAARDAKAQNGNWYPASNGTETPFISRSGRRLLYCYQPSTGKHAYLDCNTDIILSDLDAANYLQLG